MAKTLEELIILKRIALRYLIVRESKLMTIGRRPVNKKIAHFIRSHHENDVWTSFLDSLNEDLTRNINIYDWRFETAEYNREQNRFRLNSISPETLKSFEAVQLIGGKMTDSPVVTVEHGQVQGKVVTSPTGKAYYSFQGIPYAKAPLGSLRFKAPQPVEPWEDVRDCTAEGNVSAQFDPLVHKEFIGDENCLFLNVYTPNLDGEFLPVMVFIHGGGYTFGSGNSSLYGADFLVERDVVVVTINYRCGALGFLSLNTPEVPGNAGLKDMIQAVKWVKDNVQNFGGNTGNVTLFGESAGGAAVSILTACPSTKDLINKAIIQSGTALNNWAFQKNPLQNAKDLAKGLGCEADDLDEILEFLTSTPARDIVDVQEKMHTSADFFEKTSINTFAPVVEKEFHGVEAALTENFVDLITSGRVSNVPVMIGSTTLEFTNDPNSYDLSIFIPDELNIGSDSEERVEIENKIKKLYFSTTQIGVENLNEYHRLLSDKLVNVDTHRYVKYLIQAMNKPVYFYKFDYVGELNLSKKLMETVPLKHAAHADELGYLFKNIFQKDVEPTPQDVKMRERMVRLWTNFAKSGNPTPEETHYIMVTWQPVNKDDIYYLNLGNELSLGTNLDQERMQFWEDLYTKYYKIWDHPKENTEEVPERTIKPTTEEVVQIDEAIAEVSEAVEAAEATEPAGIIEEVTPQVTEPEVSIPEVIDAEVPESEKETIEVAAPEDNPVTGQQNGVLNNGSIDKEPVNSARTSNEIKMVNKSNGVPKDVIRANDPPEDDLPKNIGVNKFVNFFESLGGKK